MNIRVTPIKSFPASGRKLCLTEEAGVLTGGIRKDGELLERSFSSGAVALVDAGGETAVDPVNFAAVLEFAERIVEGDQRAATQPGAVLMLASAFIAVVLTWPVPRPVPEPAATEQELDIYAIAISRHLRRILLCLVNARGAYRTTEQLAGAVYGDDPNGGPDTASQNIHTYVCKLRKTLAQHGFDIQSSRHEGYRLRAAPVRPEVQ